MSEINAAKVFCFLPNLECGGAQRTMINIVNSLVSSEFHVFFVVATKRGHALKWIKDETSLHVLECERTRSSILPLRKLIKKHRPHVILSTMLDANIVAAAATFALRRPPVLLIRETNSHEARKDLTFFQKITTGWAYRKADKVIGLSKGVAAELISRYRIDEAKMRVIHNPVDIEYVAEQSKNKSNKTAPWGNWAGNNKIIMGIGRLSHQKGFDLLIQAFSMLKNTDVNLVIVGSGSELEALKNIAIKYKVDKKVLFAGLVDEPVDWLIHADIFVLSSRWEGFGHVIVEAMACGIPVISTKCPYGPVDIITHNETGLLVNNESVNELSDAIDNLIPNKPLKESLSKTARERCVEFDVKRITDMYKKLINESARAY